MIRAKTVVGVAGRMDPAFRETGIHDQAETRRKAKTLVKRNEQSKRKGGGGLTVKFICWLKNHLPSELSWAHALASLSRIYARTPPP